MSKILTKILLITFLSICGCSSSSYDQLEEYEVIEYSENFLYDYYFLFLKDNKENKYLLLSEKFGAGIDRPPFKKYEEIKKSKTYRIKLIPQDSLYVVRLNTLFPFRGETKIYMYDSLFISNDTIKWKVYISKNIFDRFVKIIDE